MGRRTCIKVPRLIWMNPQSGTFRVNQVTGKKLLQGYGGETRHFKSLVSLIYFQWRRVNGGENLDHHKKWFRVKEKSDKV